MSIRASCDECLHEFVAKDELAGRRVKCPECGEPVKIPSGAVRRKVDDDVAFESPPRRASSSGKKKSSSGIPPGVWIGVGIGGGVAAVAALIVMLMNGGGAQNPAPGNPVAQNVTPAMAAPTQLGTALPANNTPNSTNPGLNGAMPVGAADAIGQPNVAGQPAGAIPQASSIPQTGAGPGNFAPPNGSPTSTAPSVATNNIPAGNTSNGSALSSLIPQPPNSSGSSIPGTPNSIAAKGNSSGNASTPQAVSGNEMSMADLNDLCEPGVVRIDTESAEGSGNGSGFVVDTKGTIVTNYHVIAGARKITVAFRDGQSTPALGFLKVDTKRDVAVLKINFPADKLKPLKLAETPPRKGEKVAAFGAPLGLSWSFTEGVVSAVRPKHEMHTFGIDEVEGTWLQTSTPISPGNSGGPLITARGEVVGANTMQITIGQNLNFAISSMDILHVLKESENQQLVAFNPSSLPKVAKQKKAVLVDAVGTERGKRLLGKMNEVSLIVIAGNRDGSGDFTRWVRNKAVETVKSLKLLVRDGDETDNELMMVDFYFQEATKGKAGTTELNLHAVVICRDKNPETGKFEGVKVWEIEKNCGTMSLEKFLLGGDRPKLLEKNVNDFFSKFKGDFHKAHMEQKKLSGAATN